jgi:hypothetical protein
MAVTPQKPRLGPEEAPDTRRAPHRLTEAILLAHGFTTELLASLVRDGLATVRRESVNAGRKAIEG